MMHGPINTLIRCFYLNIRKYFSNVVLIASPYKLLKFQSGILIVNFRAVFLKLFLKKKYFVVEIFLLNILPLKMS